MTNSVDSLTYSISSQKSAGRISNKLVHKNYAVDDFDFMIIEVGGTLKEPDKYKNNFCIIPSRILLEQNILKTEVCNGKKAFGVCPPDYIKSHWSKIFWNNISTLKQ